MGIMFGCMRMQRDVRIELFTAYDTKGLTFTKASC